MLPSALRAQSAAQLRAFEETFEPLGLTALAIQVITGLWMGWNYLPGFQGLFSPANPIGMLVGVKLLLLTATAALALPARFRLIPFVVVGVLIGLVEWAEPECRLRVGLHKAGNTSNSRWLPSGSSSQASALNGSCPGGGPPTLVIGVSALVLGAMGMASVGKAVFIDKLALNCACGGGNAWGW